MIWVSSLLGTSRLNIKANDAESGAPSIRWIAKRSDNCWISGMWLALMVTINATMVDRSLTSYVGGYSKIPFALVWTLMIELEFLLRYVVRLKQRKHLCSFLDEWGPHWAHYHLGFVRQTSRGESWIGKFETRFHCVWPPSSHFRSVSPQAKPWIRGTLWLFHYHFVAP